MKVITTLLVLSLTSSAFAQSPPPKQARKSPLQGKPPAAMGCKLVGTVRGTKIWAGDCVATPLPAEIVSPPTEGAAPAEKQ